MSDLVEWLTKILDEDAAIAEQGPGLGHPNSLAYFETDEWSGVEANSRWLLADIAAKRALMDLHRGRLAPADNMMICCGSCSYRDVGGTLQITWPCQTIRLLGSAYATRDGYREEWAVSMS